MNEVHAYALKLLRVRDYSVSELRKKLSAKFGDVPEALVDQLIHKKFLNDRRFAENYVARRKERGVAAIRQELLDRGVAPDLAEEILSQTDWPSLQSAVKARMIDWNLRAPLQSRDAARLFRALLRLGYDEDAIREEIEQLHEQ